MMQRIARWNAGQEQSLAKEYLAQSNAPSRLTTRQNDMEGLPENVRRAALRACNEGALRKAASVLSTAQHPLPNDVEHALETLHPRNDVPAIPHVNNNFGEDFSPDDVAECLRSFPPGSSGGFSGLMASHLPASDSPSFARVTEQLARIASDFAWGRLQAEVNAILASARLIPIGKKDGGVRPIAVGELIRRLAGKCLVKRYQAACVPTLAPL